MDSKTTSLDKPTLDSSIDPDRLEFEAAQEYHAENEETNIVSAPIRELALGMLALASWFVLFSGGVLINTEHYRESLQAMPTVNLTLGQMLGCWILVSAFWTITNVGFLPCVAAFLGALGRRTRFTSRSDNSIELDGNEINGLGVINYYVSAIMRGFGVYALVLAGLLVMATESLEFPTQSSYMRLAPTISIISFYAGFDPSMFADLFDRVTSFLNFNNQPRN